MKNVVRFISQLEQDRWSNLSALVECAKRLSMEGFEAVEWDSAKWLIQAGSLTKSPGKRPGPAEINFCYHPSAGGLPLTGSWGNAVKALMCLRFYRSSQMMSNQRNFVTAVAFVAHEAGDRDLFQLTREMLELACKAISDQYAESTAYNLHKAVMEFADFCDANSLCNVSLQYKYSNLKRPANVGGRQQRRLEDAEYEQTVAEKMISPEVLKALGVLYQEVPVNHKYRLYVVMLTFLAFLGRRFSELALLPLQEIGQYANGERYIRIFPGKASRGDAPDLMDRVPLPTEAESIIEDCLDEFGVLSKGARETAVEMRRASGPDLRFLENYSADYVFYKEDFLALGFPDLVGANGWIRKQGLTVADPNKLTSQGIRPANPSHCTTRSAFIDYCKSLFKSEYVKPLKIDAQGKSYFPEDMMILRHMGTSSGAYTPCIALPVTHAMLSRFIKHDIYELMKQYHSDGEIDRFTSHQFRHTLNTLLDEGGLSDLMQTKWFNRKNPRDTKAYQHTSPQKKAMMYREKIKLGEVGGPIAKIYEALPVERKEAFLIAKVKAVHDVGAGMCTRVFAQSPCPKGTQCQSECEEYSWLKGSESARDEVIRMFKVQVIQYETAKQKYASKRKGESGQWLTMIEKRLGVLEQQLTDFQVDIEVLKAEALAHAS